MFIPPLWCGMIIGFFGCLALVIAGVVLYTQQEKRKVLQAKKPTSVDPNHS